MNFSSAHLPTPLLPSVYQSTTKVNTNSRTGLYVQGNQPVTQWQDNYRWFFSIWRGQRLVLIKINLLDMNYFSPQCLHCFCKSHILWQHIAIPGHLQGKDLEIAAKYHVCEVMCLCTTTAKESNIFYYFLISKYHINKYIWLAGC